MYPYVLSVLNQFLHLLRVLRGLLNSLGYALSATAGAAVMNINFSIQMMLLHTVRAPLTPAVCILFTHFLKFIYVLEPLALCMYSRVVIKSRL